jgi:hypothetical protein
MEIVTCTFDIVNTFEVKCLNQRIKAGLCTSINSALFMHVNSSQQWHMCSVAISTAMPRVNPCSLWKPYSCESQLLSDCPVSNSGHMVVLSCQIPTATHPNFIHSHVNHELQILHQDVQSCTLLLCSPAHGVGPSLDFDQPIDLVLQGKEPSVDGQ